MYYLLLLIPVLLLATIGVALFQRNAFIWIFSWLGQSKPKVTGKPVHIMFAFVDHFEPYWGKPDETEAAWRVSEWKKRYPEQVKGHTDSDGHCPKHTFFYPEEEYKKEHLDNLVELCKQGYGEIDVHLHHDNDTSEGLRDKLTSFASRLTDVHQALPVIAATGSPVYSFIHGNWCLDNSRPDGRWCGVNDELIVLRETGCYADFTLPSAPSDTQTRKINSIYYATDDPLQPKSHNDGKDVQVNGVEDGDLMIIQGPLALNLRQRKWGVLPKIENGDIRKSSPPTRDRIDLWINQHVHVKGKPEWIFVKIHTHGCNPGDLDTLLGEPCEKMYSYLESEYNDGSNYVLHYVTAREMYNIIKAAEAGFDGNPGQFRSFLIPPPAMLTD